MHLSDSVEAAIAKVQQGNREAFQVIVERYERPVFQILYRMVWNREEAADLAQETFLKAFKGLSRFNPREPFAPWLYRIAANTGIDACRRRRSRPLEIGEEFLEERLTERGSDSPEATIMAEEERRELVAAWRMLPPHHRAALALRYLEGMEYTAIGRALDLPLGTVKTHLFRAREALARRLKKEGPGTPPGVKETP